MARGPHGVWLQDDLLRSANGLLPETGRLGVSTMRGRLLAIDWNTRRITELSEGLGDDAYLVSEWPGGCSMSKPAESPAR